MRNYVGWIFSPLLLLTYSPFCVSLTTGAGVHCPDAPHPSEWGNSLPTAAECELLTAVLQKVLHSFPIQWQLEVWYQGPAPLPQLRNGWRATPTSELPKDWLGTQLYWLAVQLLPLPNPDSFIPSKCCSTVHSPKQLCEHKSQPQSLFPRESNKTFPDFLPLGSESL